MASIPITGLSSSDPKPGIYIETAFAQGPSSGDSGPSTILVLANKIPAGSAVVNSEIYGPDTTTPLKGEADMIALAGAGSEAHRMFLRMVPTNTTTPIYWLFVAESAGAAATGTITITGPATKAGNVRVWVGDEAVEVPFANAATATTIGDAVAAAINGKTSWPVTAANATGTVTLTAKNKGPRGNEIRFQCVLVAGAGAAFSPAVDTAFTGGTTADSNTTALASLKGRGDYYIVSAASDATQLAAVQAYIDTQALPTNGNRKRLVAGQVGTLAASNGLATGLNAARSEMVWLYKSIWTAAELAAHHAAIYALEEAAGLDMRTNLCGYGNDERTQGIYKVPPPRDATAWPDPNTDIKSAILNGLSPIEPNTRGRCSLVMRVTTRTLQGAIPDYRISRPHKVSIIDLYASMLGTKTALQHSGKVIGDDVGPNEQQPGSRVITPNRYRGTIFGLIDTFAGKDLLQQVPQTKTETIVQRETIPATRMSAYIPLRPVDNAEQFGVLISQVG